MFWMVGWHRGRDETGKELEQSAVLQEVHRTGVPLEHRIRHGQECTSNTGSHLYRSLRKVGATV